MDRRVHPKRQCGVTIDAAWTRWPGFAQVVVDFEEGNAQLLRRRSRFPRREIVSYANLRLFSGGGSSGAGHP